MVFFGQMSIRQVPTEEHTMELRIRAARMPRLFRKAGRRPVSLLISLALMAVLVGLAPTSSIAPVAASTPDASLLVDPANGFPLWYQDATGIRVAPCLDPADTNCVVLADATYDPSQPQVFPGNFPSEFFYTVADSQKIATTGCSGTKRGTVSVRLALEAAFTNGAPAPGEQMTFGRIRLNVTGGLCANSTYTATFPFGQKSFTTDANGALAKNQGTTDAGCAPVAPGTCDWRLALSSEVAQSYLRWDPAISPAAPDGYLGDAVTAHRITGATFTVPGETAPANYFRIAGPKLSTPLQTNLFTVSGKVAGPLSAAPSKVDFGGQNAGTGSAARQIVVTNLADQTITPGAASVAGTDAADFTVTADQCQGIALARDASCTVDVRFGPATTGPKAASLRIPHDGVRSPFSLALAGTGTADTAVATASATPTAIAFGNNRLTVQSAPRAVTVTNTGTAPLEISAASLIGTDRGEFGVSFDGCTATPVAPGASCAISVAFSPTTAQASVAQLSLASNDPSGPAFVDLSGTGYGGNAGVSATASAFDGFPDWYRDEQGVRLSQCIDPTDPNCVVLPGGTYAGQTPLAFPDNFPDEFFYTVADSELLTTPGCGGSPSGKAMIRMAVEGSFSTGQPVAGEQITFGRIRINATSGLCPNTTYTFVHPYGIDTFTADADGGIKRTAGTDDVGCLIATAASTCDFGAAVKSRVFNGFLRWDPANGAPAPAGYLGDGASLHRVVGSQFVPPGETAPANYFKIYQGDQLIAQTNMFTVMGKLDGPLVADPPSPSFGSVDQGQTATQTVTLRNEGLDPLTVNGLTTVGPQAADYALPTATDQCTGVTLAPNASCTTDVAFSPLDVGDRAARLRVDHTGLNSPMDVPLSGVGLAGPGTAALSVDANVLAFEKLHVGRSAVGQTVTVSNKGGSAPLTVEAPTLNGPEAADFTVTANTCGAEVAIDATCAMTVRFTPSAAGARTATLDLTSPAARPTSVSIALSGDGFAGTNGVSTQQRPGDGFPAWYQDTNGVRLEPCLDVNDPKCVVLGGAGFDPGQPVSFPGNYPPEFFYALADSELLSTDGCGGTTTPGSAMLRLALEGSFANGVAEAGQQTTFGRIRFHVTSGLCANTSYTFTTPYGPIAATTDAAGGVARTLGTTDVGCGAAPCDFAAALPSKNLDGFVRWAPGVGLAAPAGYLGDGVAYHLIVGGTYAPAGEPVNYFDISGPDGTSVARTGKFIVSGKLASGLVGASVAFGDQAVGSTVTRDVAFTNIDTAPVTVGSAVIAGADAGAFSVTGGTCAGAALASDASCTVSVAFSPTLGQAYAATVKVLGTGGAVLGSAAVTGHGLVVSTPRATVSPASLTYGSQRVGTAAPTQLVTVTNTGDATLEVRQPTFTGLAAADYSASPAAGCASVAPQGTCAVTITFTPTVAGTRTATMTIVSNDPGAAPTVALTGTGTTSAILLKSTTLDLGKVRAGRTATKSMSLTNSGTAPLNISALTVDDPAWFSASLGTCTGAIAPGRSCNFTVTLLAQLVAGSYTSFVRFTSDAANSPSLRVTAIVN